MCVVLKGDKYLLIFTLETIESYNRPTNWGAVENELN